MKEEKNKSKMCHLTIYAYYRKDPHRFSVQHFLFFLYIRVYFFFNAKRVS